jgi:nitronate monooxygenase
MFGLRIPIIQSPMAGIQDSTLTIAVSEAGAMGSLAAAMLSPEKLRDELQKISAATSNPYNVNFFCHSPARPDPTREARWRDQLAPYYAEFKLDAKDIPAAPFRAPFSAEAAAVLAEFSPPVVSFHFGLPEPELLQQVKDMGSKVISSATTLAEAHWLAERGVDAIIAQGLEAGGHRGMFLSADISTQVGTFALLPQIVSAVDIPVIAAGGIADAQGVRAALALGASAVQMGTAFLLCTEAKTSTVHRAALASSAATNTALTNVFSGKPARSIVNRVMREQGPMTEAAPVFPTAGAALGPIRAKAEANGSGDFSSLWAGQNVSGCREIPAAELLAQLF